jgi:hypothetical protein
MKVSPLSLMPEDLEKQLQPQELADLFAFLSMDRPPGDPQARSIPGVREVAPRATTDPAKLGDVVDDFAPGFSTSASGEGGVAVLKEHLGRSAVLRTHPVDPKTPCILRTRVEIPKDRKTRLVLDISHDRRGDWQLVVRADGKVLRQAAIGPESTRGGWTELAVDLTPYAGRTVNLELLNQANGWNWEFGYWGRIEIISE